MAEEVKAFVDLMHNAMVRFYKFDAKVASDARDSECLSNLLTSLVLRSPLYSDIHELVQAKHRLQVKKIARTIERVRAQFDLAKCCKIDAIKMGRALIKHQREELLEREQLSDFGFNATPEVPEQEISDKEAQVAFRDCILQMELIRKISSPVLKVITFAR